MRGVKEGCREGLCRLGLDRRGSTYAGSGLEEVEGREERGGKEGCWVGGEVRLPSLIRRGFPVSSSSTPRVGVSDSSPCGGCRLLLPRVSIMKSSPLAMRATES